MATTRGSEFSLCQRSRAEAAYPRYPRIPVLRCDGFAPAEASPRDAGDATGDA